MKIQLALAAGLAAAALVIPAGPAGAGSDPEHAMPRTLAEGLAGPLSLVWVGMDRLLIARLCRLMSIPTPRLLLTCSIPLKPAALPLPATVLRLRLSVSGVPYA